MLFIFRKLRRSFFLPGKVRTYLAYAVGEIALIMIGILLALQVSDWNQAREDRTEETQILLRLKADFDENQENLIFYKEFNSGILSALKAFLEVIKPEPDTVPEDSINNFMASYQMTPPLRRKTAALNSIISSGSIALIKNQTLNQKLNEWSSLLEEHDDWAGYIHTGMNVYKPFLVEHYQIRDSGRFLWPDDFGTSNFHYDQKALLSKPILESAIEDKREKLTGLLIAVDRLSEIQQSILTLIDAELHASQ